MWCAHLIIGIIGRRWVIHIDVIPTMRGLIRTLNMPQVVVRLPGFIELLGDGDNTFWSLVMKLTGLVLSGVLEIFHGRGRWPLFPGPCTLSFSALLLLHLGSKPVEFWLLIYKGEVLHHNWARGFIVGAPTLLWGIVRNWNCVLRFSMVICSTSEVGSGRREGRWVVIVNRHDPICSLWWNQSQGLIWRGVPVAKPDRLRVLRPEHKLCREFPGGVHFFLLNY